MHIIPESLDDSDPTLTQSHVTFDIIEGQTNDVGVIEMPVSRIRDGQARGSFGFTIKKWNHDADQATQIATVIEVVPDGPAARAGVMVGDIIVGMDGVDVRGNGRSTLEYFLRVPVGTEAVFKLKRGLKLSLRAE